MIGRISARPSTKLHISFAVWAWSAATALARRASRSPATVMLKRAPAERRELVVGERRVGDLAEPLDRVALVSGQDRRVRREDDLVAGRGHGVLVAHAPRRLLADKLERRQQGVALVKVVQVHADPERPERADAADAEDDLLGHAVLLGAAVEPGRRLAVRVPVEVGVEKVERDVPKGVRLPHLAPDVVAADLDRDLDARVFEEPVGRVVDVLV